MPAIKEMPSTLRRSSSKAQRTWAKAHDNAVETYGEGERAHRTAFAALKHSFEKKGDRWVEKDHKGPSDPKATAARAGCPSPRQDLWRGRRGRKLTRRALRPRAQAPYPGPLAL